MTLEDLKRDVVVGHVGRTEVRDRTVSPPAKIVMSPNTLMVLPVCPDAG